MRGQATAHGLDNKLGWAASQSGCALTCAAWCAVMAALLMEKIIRGYTYKKTRCETEFQVLEQHDGGSLWWQVGVQKTRGAMVDLLKRLPKTRDARLVLQVETVTAVTKTVTKIIGKPKT